MKQTLNDIKKTIFKQVLGINEKPDISNHLSDIVFFFGIKATFYKKSKTYSIKDTCEEGYIEISNRYVLLLMCKNLELLCQKKQRNWKFKLKRLQK